MGRIVLFCLRGCAIVAVITSTAAACGDPSAAGIAKEKAQLVIQTEAGSIRMGEPVYASLILPKDSELQAGTLTRASCTSFQFKVEPQVGWHDPWADWYYSGIPQHATGEDGPYQCGVVAGSMGGVPLPPPQIKFTLNEWVQFDKPGKYVLSVTYRTRYRSRQEVLDDPYDDRKSRSWVTLVTDAVEVEVKPESTDVSERAANAFTFLGSHFRDEDPSWGSSDSTTFPEWTFYSQAETVVPLLAQFYEQGHWRARGALLASPHQQRVVREMEFQLKSPRHSVSPDFLELLAFNRTRLERPDLFGSSTQNQWTAQWEADSNVRNQLFLEYLSGYTEQLLEAIPQKDHQAQSDCLRVALLALARWNVPRKSVLRQRAIDETALLFPNINPGGLWEEQWRVVASPAMIPALRRIVSQGSPLDEQELRWFYELSPLKARILMIAAIRRDDWDAVLSWASAIGPHAESSAFLDQYIMRDLRQGAEPDDEELRHQQEWLLLRFGGRDLAKPVREMLASQPCLGEPLLWAFLLRVEGIQAEKTLIDHYRKSRDSGGCQADATLQQILWADNTANSITQTDYWSPALEGIILSQLSQGEDSIAIGAAGLLSLYGSSEVESNLWAKFEIWHKSPPLRPKGMSLERSDDLEYALVSAILNGHGWVPTHYRLERLHALCVYDCEKLKWARPVEQLQYLTVNENLSGPATYGVASTQSPMFSWDAFHNWIERFPSGTRFVVSGGPGGARLTPAQVESQYPELNRLLRERNLQVINVSPFDSHGRCLSERTN